MKAAAVAFLLAVLFTGAVALGVVRLGSSGPPPRAIVLPAGARAGLPAHSPGRAAVRQRVEGAPLSAFAPPRSRIGQP
jgi:hypothetical protein